MKFTIPLTKEFNKVSESIPAERVFPFLPKEGEFLKDREKMTLLSVTVRSKNGTGLLTIARQCFMVLAELPVLPLRGIMFNKIPDEAESLTFEFTSFLEVAESSL